MKLFLYLLIRNAVQHCPNWHHCLQSISAHLSYFLCWAGKENDCLQQAVFFCCVHSSCSLRQECVNALQATWHPECFLCTHCKQPIGGNQFHIEEGKPYCEKGGHFSASFCFIFLLTAWGYSVFVLRSKGLCKLWLLNKSVQYFLCAMWVADLELFIKHFGGTVILVIEYCYRLVFLSVCLDCQTTFLFILVTWEYAFLVVSVICVPPTVGKFLLLWKVCDR